MAHGLSPLLPPGRSHFPIVCVEVVDLAMQKEKPILIRGKGVRAMAQGGWFRGFLRRCGRKAVQLFSSVRQEHMGEYPAGVSPSGNEVEYALLPPRKPHL